MQQTLGLTGQVVQFTVVGHYLKNMTYTDITQNLTNAQIIKQYKYSNQPGNSSPIGPSVNIVFNALGQFLSVNVVDSITTNGH
ncbi:unnamed protein product [Didymodactylos carnosus]|uniref:Uncharacterized protein n=1 Tax=Didymodactylos carnosus TaxID=1234261 RepID=A0A815XWQ4_9BILA|nr:unnamed protein product [Didymodactylos carnosus]CAF1562693.1 unnamed protein product [Didymodactylos carnosus]CAF4253707.1 unnamed protein product [Didymodactylos carnosus]CAF4424237.1 unnamed protein product [Didymodactylos carnosus]